MKPKYFLFYALTAILLISCAKPQEKQASQTSQIDEDSIMEAINMKLTSPDFMHNGNIPLEFTCDGSDVSPSLIIGDVPKNTKSLALIMDDPDAPVGTFVHWVVWNIPAGTKEIRKAAEPNGIRGKTGFGRLGYGGPCPPSGTQDRKSTRLNSSHSTLSRMPSSA